MRIQFSKITSSCTDIYTFTETPSEPSITLLGPPVESADVVSIATCTFTGFWPADINMTWTLQGGPIEPALNQKVTENNTFVVTSEYELAVNRTLNGKSITCTVSHVSLTAPRSLSVPLTVLCEYNDESSDLLSFHVVFTYSYFLHDIKMLFIIICLESITN